MDSGLCATSCGVVQANPPRSGECVAVTLPADAVYFEKIELPNVSWHDAEKLVEGQLDLKLPVPVEKCIVRKCPVKSSRTPVFLAFAIPAEEFVSRLSTIREEIGCDPEAVYPVTEILWRAYLADHAGDASPAIVMHAGNGAWSLLAVDGSVPVGTVCVSHGDVAGATRSAKILSMRFPSSVARLEVFGECADDSLVSALESAMQIKIERPLDYASHLAVAIARAGEEGKSDCGFRSGEFAHRASGRRKCLYLFLLGLVPMLLALGMLVSALGEYITAAESNTLLMAECSNGAEKIAGEAIPQRGRAAIERAKTLFDWRNPSVTAFSRKMPIDTLPFACRLAADTGMTFSSVSYDGIVLRLTVRGATEKSIGAWRSGVGDEGFELDADLSEKDVMSVVTIRNAEVAQ